MRRDSFGFVALMVALYAALSIVLWLAFAGFSFAENQKRWMSQLSGTGDSTVTIHEPTREGAEATVTFINTTVHSMTESFALTYGEITVTVYMEWQVGGGDAEAITVEAPPGYVAVPRRVEVAEDDTGEVHIIKYRGA